jgi:O-methyltransferase involved in polyketide biosynthesis
MPGRLGSGLKALKMNQDYEKISPTAVLVAGLRAKYTDMPYAKEVYKAVRQITKPYFSIRTPSFVSHLARFAPRSINRVVFFESRYLSVDETLRNSAKGYAVVEIAAGLSARGLQWSRNNPIYIETDLPGMLSIKQRVFNKVLGGTGASQNPNHHFYPLNALDYNDWDRLGKEFFDEKKSGIAVIHEGLASYLSREEKEKLRYNIKKFFENYSSSGIWITPDFYPYQAADKTWIVKLVERRVEQRTGRRYDHFFAGHKEVVEFLTQGGFQVVFSDSTSVLERLTCIGKMHLDEEKVKKALKRFIVYSALSNDPSGM